MTGIVLMGGASFVGLAGLVDRLLGSGLEAWEAAGGPAPEVRLRRHAWRAAIGLGMAGAGSLALLWRVFAFGAECPEFPAALVACHAHGPADGPGAATGGLGLVALGGLALGCFALFRPLPAAPRGRRREDLSAGLAALGAAVPVEEIEAAAPVFLGESLPRPRVVVSSGALARLAPDELSAALAHEAEHFRAGDHGVRLLARAHGRLMAVAGTRGLFEAVVEAQEERADAAAAARSPGAGEALARALLRIASSGGDPLDGAGRTAAGLGGGDGVERRVLRLLGRRLPPRPRPSFPWGPVGALGGIVALVASRAGACLLHCIMVGLP